MHLETVLCIYCQGLDPQISALLPQIQARPGFKHEFIEGVPSKCNVQTLRRQSVLLLSAKYFTNCDYDFVIPPIIVAPTPTTYTAKQLALLEDVWFVPSVDHFEFYFTHYLDRLAILRRLRRKELYFETMLHTTPDLVWFKNCQGDHFSVSDTFCKTTKKTSADIEGKGHAYIWGMDEEEYARSPLACKESDARVLRSGQLDVTDELVQSQRGIRTFSTWKGALLDADGEIIGTAGIAHDVTDMNTMSAELELLLSNLPFAVLITDENNRIININDKFRNLFTEPDKIVSSDIYYHVSVDRHDDIQSICDQELQEITQIPGVHLQPHVTDLYIEIQHKDILDQLKNRVGSIVIFRDITNDYHKKLLLEKRVYEDALTGLFNRRYFYEKIVKKFEQGGVLYLDLDQFKQLNDTCGHEAGDQCLKIVGRVLKKVSNWAVRMGGDEFAVYLPKISAKGLEACALKIVTILEKELQGDLACIRASIGLALWSEACDSLETLVRHADLAMYHNKLVSSELAELNLQLDYVRYNASAHELTDLMLKIKAKEELLTPFTWYTHSMQEEHADLHVRR
ncbi:MAG: diguanylate cyclase [Desulfovibrionaceae bacterium]|nr:diguanylate cyclase [Desulfovibrionaceae bacterium]